MTTERNIAVLRRWLGFADAGFRGDFGEFISPGYSGHLSGRIHMDLPELQRLERAFAEAFGDVTRTVEEVWGSGDRVVLRVTTRATHRGDFNGIPATGRRVQLAGIVIYRFEQEKIAESWGELDFAGLWRQLTLPRPTVLFDNAPRGRSSSTPVCRQAAHASDRGSGGIRHLLARPRPG